MASRGGPQGSTGAEHLLQAAVEAGIEVCLANPGALGGRGSGRQAGGRAAARGAEGPCDSQMSLNCGAGTSEMHFVSALDAVGGMRAVLGLHETVCTGAAGEVCCRTTLPRVSVRPC